MEPETIHSRMLVAAGRLNFSEIAELTGVHPENVRRYMNGSPPSADFIAAFCAGLGISADWLILGRPPMTTTDSIRVALRAVPEGELFAAVASCLKDLDQLEGPADASDQDREGEPTDETGLRRPGDAFDPGESGPN